MKNTAFQRPLSPAAGFVTEAPKPPRIPPFPRENPILRIQWAMDSPLKGATKWTLIVLARHADKQGKAFPSLATIGRANGCSRATVLRALRKLESLGWIVRETGGWAARTDGRRNRTEPLTTYYWPKSPDYAKRDIRIGCTQSSGHCEYLYRFNVTALRPARRIHVRERLARLRRRKSKSVGWVAAGSYEPAAIRAPGDRLLNGTLGLSGNA